MHSIFSIACPTLSELINTEILANTDIRGFRAKKQVEILCIENDAYERIFLKSLPLFCNHKYVVFISQLIENFVNGALLTKNMPKTPEELLSIL